MAAVASKKGNMFAAFEDEDEEGKVQAKPQAKA